MAHSLILSTQKTGSFGLSKNETAILQAQKSIQVRQMTNEQLEQFAKNILTYVKTKLDLKPIAEAEETAKILVLMDDIKEHPNLTKDEVTLALKNGLNGKYLGKESFVHFNSSNFNIWLQKFEIEKVEAMKIIPKVEEEETKPVPSKEEILKDVIEATNGYADIIEMKLKEDDSHNWILGGLNYFYDDLVLLGVLSFNTEQKKAIVRDVRLKHPRLPEEDLSNYCKKYGYIAFVEQLAKSNQRLDSKGNIINKINK